MPALDFEHIEDIILRVLNHIPGVSIVELSTDMEVLPEVMPEVVPDLELVSSMLTDSVQLDEVTM